AEDPALGISPGPPGLRRSLCLQAETLPASQDQAPQGTPMSTPDPPLPPSHRTSPGLGSQTPGPAGRYLRLLEGGDRSDVEIHQEQRDHRGLSQQDGDDLQTCVWIQKL